MKHTKAQIVQFQEVDFVTCDRCGTKIDTGVEIKIVPVCYEAHGHMITPPSEKEYCSDCWGEMETYLANKSYD